MNFFIQKLTEKITEALRKPKKAKSRQVYLPIFFLLLGILVCLIVFTIMLVAYFSGASMGDLIGLSTLSFIGLILILGYWNCRITYDENGFTAKNILGIKKRYRYLDITGISKGRRDQYLYVGKRKILLDEIAIGKNEFLSFVKKQYRISHGGQSIPQMNVKKDIFNGHIENPGEFIFIYIITSVFFIGGSILCMLLILSPLKEEDTTHKTTIFISCEQREDELILNDGSETIYRLRFSPEELPLEKILSVCDGKTKLDIYVTEITPDDGDAYSGIKAIYCNGESVFSFEDYNTLNRAGSRPIFLLLIGFCLLWGAFIVVSIIVGRNPNKYRRIIYWFFKPSYVNFDK